MDIKNKSKKYWRNQMKKNISFLVDSGSDFESYLATYLDYPVKVIPLHLHLAGKEYLDGVDISKSTFFKEMEQNDELPKTSQPTPHNFHEIFKEELDKGNKIIYVSIASTLSGTHQSAVIAKEMLTKEEQENIYIFDSLNVSATILFILFKANELLNQDLEIPAVLKELEVYRDNVRLIALLDTLENLKKGGRISMTQATIGGLLNIKPLISIEDGYVTSLDKFRGRKKGLKYIATFINDPKNHIDKNKIFFVHSYTSEERLQEEYKELNLSEFKEVIFLKLGTTVGTHAGANTVGLIYQYNR